MDVPYPAPLTAEQIAAVNAGAGHARLIDPGTQVVYHVIAQADKPTISDDYVREKLAEAQADVDRGDVALWDVAELKQELRERHARKSSGG
jgi:alkylation response protein AidB-like acyl-CoA dehydrogenase